MKCYQMSWFVSSNEAVWKIFEFPIHERFHMASKQDLETPARRLALSGHPGIVSDDTLWRIYSLHSNNFRSAIMLRNIIAVILTTWSPSNPPKMRDYHKVFLSMSKDILQQAKHTSRNPLLPLNDVLQSLSWQNFAIIASSHAHSKSRLTLQPNQPWSLRRQLWCWGTIILLRENRRVDFKGPTTAVVTIFWPITVHIKSKDFLHLNYPWISQTKTIQCLSPARTHDPLRSNVQLNCLERVPDSICAISAIWPC